MKFMYWSLVKVKDHPSLEAFFGKDQLYRVVNFKAIEDNERIYLIQPEGLTNKYKVKESNLELVEETPTWP